jgi:hypothetical protein
MRQFDNLADAQTLALAIVDTFPEPFLVLDETVLRDHSPMNGLELEQD